MGTNTTFGTYTAAITTALNSLADNAGTSPPSTTGISSAIDFSTTDHIGIEIEAQLTGVSASNVDTCDIYLLESADGGTTFETVENRRYVGSVQMNGTTESVKRMITGNVSDHFKILLVNESGAALAATGNTVYYRAISQV
jgi:hypothetical protein